MHTPGPWFIRPIPGTIGYDVIAQTGRAVARFMSADDAALIHAATDLLAALADLVENEPHADTERWTRAHDAIAKAKGSKP